MGIRRWRGTIDVPLTDRGKRQAANLAGLELDAIYYDHLSRCRDTASLIGANVYFESSGPRPWNMGELFDGREITDDSLKLARYYILNPLAKPPKGEPFDRWAAWWLSWINGLKTGFGAVGVVTHNRNIQYLYSLHSDKFVYKLYDCDGPDFCTVHVYNMGHIAPWGGKGAPKGVYLIRHGETSFGT